VIVGGYDESKLEFLTLEGIASIVSHALLEVVEDDFVPLSYIAVYFYTRSREILGECRYATYSEDHIADSNRHYGEDRASVIQGNVLNDSILFIDGPLIGGNLTSYTLDLVRNLHAANVVPVFV